MIERSPVKSIGEICDRYKCVAHVENNAPLPDIPVYASLTIESKKCSIATTLSAAIAAVRPSHEISEVFVREIGEEIYAALQKRHFSAEDGSWVIVAKKRHPSNEPRIVGIMLAKDEADVAAEVVGELAKVLQCLYFFAFDEPTKSAILASAPIGWARAVPDLGARGDGYRQVLLERAREDALAEGDPRPMWVMVVQGDEIYDDDLRLHIQRAQSERATVMTCQVATFLIHESQREGWDWTQSLAKRLTHYIWDFGEHTGFLNFPWIYYDPAEHMRAHPHGIFPGKWASARPVRKHYPFRTPDQARARIEDRLKSGWQPHYENYRQIFMGAEAAGRPLKRYHGWFPEAERVEGIW